MLLQILLLGLSISPALLENPGYRIHIPPSGTDFLFSEGGNAIVNILKNTTLSEFSIQSGKATIDIANVTTSMFQNETWKYYLAPPDLITYGLSGANLAMIGGFTGTYKVWYLPTISTSGEVKIMAGNVTLQMTLSVTVDKKGMPNLYASNCVAKLGTFDLQLGGTLLFWLLQIFHKLIAEALEPKVGPAICSGAVSAINNNFAAKIATLLPNPYPIAKGFDLNYTLYNFDVGTNSLDMSGLGAIVYEGKPPSMTPPPLDIPSDINSKMIYFWLSEYVLNTGGSAAHTNGVIKFEINKNTVPAVASTLRTTCPESLCFGSLIGELTTDYPNKDCSIYINSTSAPVFAFESGGITFSMTADLDFGILGTPIERFAGASFSLNLTVTPMLYESILNGTGKVNNLNMVQQFNKLKGPINWVFFKNYAQFMLQDKLTHLLKKGFAIPDLEGFGLVNPSLTLDKKTMGLATDLSYHAA